MQPVRKDLDAVYERWPAESSGGMGAIEDLRNWLKEIPLWQELGKVPERVTAVEKRLAELEAKLQPAPGKRCDGCGHLSLRLESSRVVGSEAQKYTKLKWKCENCGKGFEERKCTPHQERA